jgi:hypothetical protein
MKKTVFWDVAPCIYCVKRRFGGTYRSRIFLLFSSTLKMEVIRSSEKSFNTIYTGRHIPEDCFLLNVCIFAVCLISRKMT